MMNDWQLGAMYGHLGECNRCSRLDTAVRRGLLVARNLPTIEPSREFMPRLEARLREQDRSAPRNSPAGMTARFGVAAVAIAVVGLVVIGRTPWGNASPAPGEPAAVVVPHAREYPASGSWGFELSAGSEYTGRASAPEVDRGPFVSGPVVFQTASTWR